MQETSTRSPACTRPDAGADLLDGADGLVAEHAARLHLGHVALEDVQVGAADGDGVDPHDGVVSDPGSPGRGPPPRPLARAVVHESLHDGLLVVREPVHPCLVVGPGSPVSTVRPGSSAPEGVQRPGRQ